MQNYCEIDHLFALIINTIVIILINLAISRQMLNFSNSSQTIWLIRHLKIIVKFSRQFV